MSCPDWQAVCRRHEAEPEESSEWRSALAHLDGCASCQETATAVDPLLLFRRLPAPEANDTDVDAMKEAVHAMRRGERFEQRRRQPSRALLRAAALAAVALGSLLLRGAGSAPEAPAPVISPEMASEIDLLGLPLIEAADPSYGEIIQLVDDEISVVFVMPATVAPPEIDV